MLKLVIFDFDGVIADSEPAHFEMFRQICQEEGIIFTWEEYKEKYLGYADVDCFTTVLRDLGQNPTEQQIIDLVKRKGIKFKKYIEENSVILPGVGELLEELQAGDVICSICSGALRHEIEFILKQAELSEFFNVIIAAEDVSRGKPDPQGYQMALQKTNESLDNGQVITPAECLVIEDSTWGIQAAIGAEMKCLAVATTYPEEFLRKYTHATIPDLSYTNRTNLENLLAGSL